MRFTEMGCDPVISITAGPAGLHTAPSEAAARTRVPLLHGALGHGASLQTRQSIAFGTAQGRRYGPVHASLACYCGELNTFSI